MRADSRSQTVEIRPEDGQTLVFQNDPTQTLIVQNFAEGTTTPLPGAVFLISDSGGERLGTEDGRFTTDENGQIILPNLVPGVTITAKEVQAPEGYALDGTAKSIKIKSGESQTLTFYDTPKQAVFYKGGT